MSKPQILWAMIDKTGYIFPHSVRHLRKDVIDEIGRDFWERLRGDGRKIVKIETSPDVSEAKNDQP